MAPLGVVATTRAIADHFEDHFFAHGHTYEAHPLTLAPAIAAIDEYRRLDLIDALASCMGEKLGGKLARARGRSTRRSATCAAWASSGRVELVKDRATKQPFNTAEDKVGAQARWWSTR